MDDPMHGILPTAFTDTQKKGKIKRPPNAYNLFYMEQQPILRSENALVSGNDISKELGRRWKEMTDDERKPYQEQAKQIWEGFRQENPDYHYEKNKDKHKKQKDTSIEESQLSGFWMEWLTSHILAQYAMGNRDISDAVVSSITSESLPMFLANMAENE